MARPTRPRYEGMRVFISHRYSRRPRALHRADAAPIRGHSPFWEKGIRDFSLPRDRVSIPLVQRARTWGSRKQTGMSVRGRQEEKEINNQDNKDIISEMARGKRSVATLGDDNAGMQWIGRIAN